MNSMTQNLSPIKKPLLSVSRHIIKVPQQQQQQKLSYQTNKLAQYIQLQLSDLQNTLHYIQKKHSINQIKQSISHSYNIFSQTQPIFRQLRINFVYEKIKKLVNCFSIIYLILIQHIEKPSRFSIESDSIKNNQGQPQTFNHYEESTVLKKITLNEKKNTINNLSQFNQCSNSPNNGIRKAKTLGGIHLYNEQYNRHIQSDLDRLKRKLKQQAKQLKQSQNPKLSQKQRLKQQIFKQINTDIYGSPSPDQLTLFFNLNGNRYGSDLQYLTFQDQLQQIAAFFKQSQDQALQFLNKSRDEFIFLNFNQGFKQALTQYKTQKQQQVNGFVIKVKNLFQMVKFKTLQKQNQINTQYIELKKLQEKINKPQTFEIESQTSYNYDEEIARLKKKLQQLQNNYNSLRDFKKNQNQTQQQNLTYLQHKIAFKDHQINIIKKQLQQKSHFIDFLNQKINQGTDPKVLRKISNLYRNHSKKNSSKLKIQLQQLEKQTGIDLNSLKNQTLNKVDSQSKNYKKQNKLTQGSQQSDQQQSALKRSQKKNLTTPVPQFQKSPAKRKRKPGISFFTSNDKKFASFIQRNASFNFQNSKIQQANSQMQGATSQDIPLFEQKYQQNQQDQNKNNLNNEKNPIKQKKNLVKNDKRKMQDRSSLQVVQKSKQKRFQPKRSAFAEGLGNKYLNKQTTSRRTSKVDSLDQNNISQQSEQNSMDQQQNLMKQINNRADIGNFEDENNLSQSQQDQTQRQVQNQFYSENIKQFNQSKVKNTTKYKQQMKSQNSVINMSKNIKFSNQNLLNVNQKNTQGKGIINNQGKNRLNSQNKINNRQQSSIRQKLSKQGQTNKKQGQKQAFSKQKAKVNLKSSIKKTYSTQIENNENNQANKVNKRFQSFQTKQQNLFNQLGKGQNQDQQRKYQDLALQSSQRKKIDIKVEQDGVSQREDKEYLQGQQISDQINTDKSQTARQQVKKVYYTNLYKQQKLKTTNLNSKIIDIIITPQKTYLKQPQKTTIKSHNQLSISNRQLSNNKINILPPNTKAQYLSIYNRSKNSQSGTTSDFHKTKKGKLSQLPFGDSLLKFRDNKIVSENLIENLTTFHQISNTTEEVKEDEEIVQDRNKVQMNLEKQELKKKQNNSSVKNRDIQNGQQSGFQRIYGLTSTSSFRYQNQNSIKQRMQDLLQRNAAKIALKCKTIQQFKIKIKKAHMSKCGQTCRHLQRYVQNFGKYKSNNRQILKIHIQNVNHSISHSQLVNSKQKQNCLNFPAINSYNNTANGFNIGNNNLNPFNNTFSTFKTNSHVGVSSSIVFRK